MGSQWPVLPELDTEFKKLWFLIVFSLPVLLEGMFRPL